MVFGVEHFVNRNQKDVAHCCNLGVLDKAQLCRVTPTPGRAGNNNLMDCICRNAKSQRFSLPPQNIYLHSSDIQNQCNTLLESTKQEFMFSVATVPTHTGRSLEDKDRLKFSAKL